MLETIWAFVNGLLLMPVSSIGDSSLIILRIYLQWVLHAEYLNQNVKPFYKQTAHQRVLYNFPGSRKNTQPVGRCFKIAQR
uniref:Secreted protein n=1 Tax=Pyxicephalus adspersus TaxID=30357 RepID=A0AAV3B330_PYXAD|nr:TPA: hypothetical protein GDO54_000268 [Pyxicephalus adspersus]